MTIGFRVIAEVDRVDPALTARYHAARLPSANVADVMWRYGAVRDVHRIGAGDYLAGPALTVRTRPSDNLMVHKALDMARPGDVIVVDAAAGRSHAIVGGLMCSYAAERGAGGLVVDGAVRDAEELAALPMPVYARSVTPHGPFKDGPGEINVPVSCGGVVVSPGDLVVGDADGVVVVPRHAAAEVFDEARALRKREDDTTVRIAEGTWDRAWIDRKLDESGCEYVGGR